MTQLTIPDLAGKAFLVTGASTGIGAAANAGTTGSNDTASPVTWAS